MPTTENPIPVAELSYAKALAELEQILRKMQNDSLDIDSLAACTRRAIELLRHCRGKLTATDAELRAILAELESQG